MRFKELLILLIGIALGLFGLIMMLGAALNWKESDDRLGDGLLAVGVGILPVAAGVYLGALAIRRSRRRRLEQLERDLLELASASGGTLTPRQVAQATSLTLGEAKTTLEEMHLSGHCQADLGSDGSISYRFVS